MRRMIAKRTVYSLLLVTAWALMGYSVLFGGFSTTLADYGPPGWTCQRACIAWNAQQGCTQWQTCCANDNGGWFCTYG